MRKKPEFLEVPLYLTQTELDLLERLPGTRENLIGVACEEYLKNPVTFGGPSGGRLYPVRIKLATEVAERLQDIHAGTETALRSFFASIDPEYISQLRRKAEGGSDEAT